jgi:hypothetical protein
MFEICLKYISYSILPVLSFILPVSLKKVCQSEEPENSGEGQMPCLSV